MSWPLHRGRSVEHSRAPAVSLPKRSNNSHYHTQRTDDPGDGPDRLHQRHGVVRFGRDRGHTDKKCEGKDDHGHARDDNPRIHCPDHALSSQNVSNLTTS